MEGRQLSIEQVSSFARNGFLQVSELIDGATCIKLIDHTWTRLPPSWQRHDSTSWQGVVEDSCHVADLKHRRGFLQFQKGDLLGDAVVDGAFGSCSIGGLLAYSLLGHELAAMKVRGLYAIVPLPDDVKYSPQKKPHIESHAAQLIALCYLADVRLGSGGLLVWPGSHRDVYPRMGSKLEHVSTSASEAAFQKWAEREPIELPGKQGDVIIIHHRLLHAPSLNRSENIRFAFLCDYKRRDFKKLCSERPSFDLWEDWPAISRLPDRAKYGAPDFALNLQAIATKKSQDERSRTPQLAPHIEATASSTRKADASVLARSRKEGDIWIAVSDSPLTKDDTELFPRGSNLEAANILVACDGKPVCSLYSFDIISQVSVSPGEHTVELSNLDRKVWLRVLQIRLPFRHSRMLLQAELGPLRNQARFVF